MTCRQAAGTFYESPISDWLMLKPVTQCMTTVSGKKSFAYLPHIAGFGLDRARREITPPMVGILNDVTLTVATYICGFGKEPALLVPPLLNVWALGLMTEGIAEVG